MAGKTSKPKTNEEIVSGFQALRAEQRRLANKLSEIEGDQKEHQIVIEALKNMDGDRKAFRLLGGVLTERTVGAVLPELQEAQENFPEVLATLEKQLRAKGEELTAYVTEHNLRISRDEPPAVPSDTSSSTAAAAPSNVLVAN